MENGIKKDWTGNSVSVFKQLGASSHSKEARDQNDYYATDPKAIDDLLKFETFNHNIWECANGGGSSIRPFKKKRLLCLGN